MNSSSSSTNTKRLKTAATHNGMARETGEGSRSEVRGFRNFEPRTSNFGSILSRAYNPTRRHSTLGSLSPMEFEMQAG
jgi:hypothetical protein